MSIRLSKCDWCKHEYFPTTTKQRFCSPICRMDYHEQKSRTIARNYVLDEVLEIPGLTSRLRIVIEKMKEGGLV